MKPDNHAATAIADDALFAVAEDWQGAGHRLVFGVVIRTWGSSPRQMGSVMLVRDDRTIAGSVSGGCVEGAVVEAALGMMDSAGSQRLDFGVADADAWDVGFLVAVKYQCGWFRLLMGILMQAFCVNRPPPWRDGKPWLAI